MAMTTDWTHRYTHSDGTERRCLVLRDDPDLLMVAVETDVPVPLDHPQFHSENASRGFALPEKVVPL